jgi:hypothetical protein
VWRESGRGKSRFKIRDLLADGRCSQAVLDFLSTTAPAEEDVGSEVSEWELRERREREEEGRAEAEELGGNNPCSSPRPPSWRPRTRFRERATVSFLLSLRSTSWDRPGQRAKGSLQRAAIARTADRKTGQFVSRHDLSIISRSFRRCTSYPLSPATGGERSPPFIALR